MKAKAKAAGNWALEWRESKTVRRQDELWAGERIVATLRWKGLFSTLVTARSAEGAWTFERPRALSKDVEVRSAASGELVAVFHYDWLGNGGKLEWLDGPAVYWQPTDFWQTQWTFADERGELLLRLADNSRLFRREALVEVVSTALAASEQALLILLGWYLMALQDQDTAAVAGAIVAATG